MEKPNFVRNGGLRLPIGFRFHPTDEELIVHYLKRKIYSLPLPASVIPELDVFQTNPWDLPGDLREKRYFFSRRKENVNKCSTVQAGCGYWKALGQDEQIMAPGSNQIVGIKKSLVFYQQKRPNGIRTRWVMHQYCFVDSLTNLCPSKNLIMQVGDWVVCRIYQKKRKAKKNGSNKQESNKGGIGNMGVIRPSNVDSKIEHNAHLGPPQASSSCSSGITEMIPVTELDQEVTSVHYCNSLPSSSISKH